MEAVGLELAFDAVAGAAAAGSFRITALNHEVLDNAVENNAVIEMFLDQADEVVDGFGSNIRIKPAFMMLPSSMVIVTIGFFCAIIIPAAR